MDKGLIKWSTQIQGDEHFVFASLTVEGRGSITIHSGESILSIHAALTHAAGPDAIPFLTKFLEETAIALRDFTSESKPVDASQPTVE